jgi:flagellar basal-body rod protein FlgF
MDKFLYVSANATEAVMKVQASHMNNLANASTVGFREDLVKFVSKTVSDDSNNTRVYGEATPIGSNFSYGEIKRTGNAMDIAIIGDGWIAVDDGRGNEAYTRAGNLKISTEGLLETSAGFVVKSSGGPIALPPAESLEIASDGTITIRPAGQRANSLVQLNKIKLVNPPVKDLKKDTNGLFYLPQKSPAEVDNNVRISQGAIEGSNVNPVGTLLSIMDLSRQYEMHIKLIKQAEKFSETSAQIMQIE